MSRFGPDSQKALTKGRERKLTNSEVNRGYLFISSAKYSDKFLSNTFTVIFDNCEFPNRKLDNYGRVYLGRKFLSKYKEIPIVIQVKNKSVVIVSTP